MPVYSLTRAKPATQDSHHEASKDTKKGQVIKKIRAHLTFVVQQLFFVVFVGRRMAVLLGSVIRNRNLARNHNLECGTHELLHCHHERAIRP